MHPKRINFVKLLIDFNTEIGLKSAKELMDLMLDGIPIKYSIEDHQVIPFVKKLDELNLIYAITNG